RIWEIYVLALANGTVMAFDSPGRQSMLPSLVPREDLSNAVALNSTIFNASRVIGPPLAGLVYAAVGPGWCFAVNAVSFLAILYSLWILRLAPAPTGIVRTHLLDDLREGIAYVRGHHVVRTLLILVALAVIGSGPLNAAIAGTLGNWLGADRTIGISGLAMGLAVGIVALRNRAVVAVDLARDQGASPLVDSGADGHTVAESTED